MVDRKSNNILLFSLSFVVAIIIGIIIIIVMKLYVIRGEKFGNSFEVIQSLIPDEAKNCPHMQAMNINLTDINYMRDNWKKVRRAVESGYMPPPGYENIWTDEQKRNFLKKLTQWGEKFTS